MEFIRQKRQLYEKPIVMNLDHENQLRACNRNKNVQVFKFFAKQEKPEKKICNKKFPVCAFTINNQNRKNVLIEYWVITRSIKDYFDKNPLITNYFFERINIQNQKESIVNKTNKECFATAKCFFEILSNVDKINLEKSSKNLKAVNSSIKEHSQLSDKDNVLFDNENNTISFNKTSNLHNIKKSEEIYAQINISENKNYFEEDLLSNNTSLPNSLEPSELEDLLKIKKLNEEFSKSLDQINLKNLEIVNFNIKGFENVESHNDRVFYKSSNHFKKSINKSNLNLITNFDQLENIKNELDAIDNLMIERNIHVCKDSESGIECEEITKKEFNLNKTEIKLDSRDSNENLNVTEEKKNSINNGNDFKFQRNNSNDIEDINKTKGNAEEKTIQRVEFDFENRSDVDDTATEDNK
jgi:hypothetical protein